MECRATAVEFGVEIGEYRGVVRVRSERELREMNQWVASYACKTLVAEGKRVSQEECIADLRRRVGNF
jgi:hypothetical protein